VSRRTDSASEIFGVFEITTCTQEHKTFAKQLTLLFYGNLFLLRSQGWLGYITGMFLILERIDQKHTIKPRNGTYTESAGSIRCR
jgi:hypothetical protein